MRRQNPLKPTDPGKLQNPERVRGEIEKLQRLATVLDQAVRIPGTRIGIGLDAVIGLIPVAGDLFSAGLSTWLVFRAARIGAPRPLVARMLANTGIDALLGALPVLGDLFDIGWRANSRNLALLLTWLQEQERQLQATKTPASPGWLRLLLVATSGLFLALGLWGGLWLLQNHGGAGF